MSISLQTAALSLLAAMVLLPGCAAKAVSDSNRDTTRSFDGRWRVLVRKSPAIQHVSNWRFRCNSNPYSFAISVKEGIAYYTGVGGSGIQLTNVGKNGKFTFLIPYKTNVTASNSSNHRVTFIGNLSEHSLSGSYSYGSQQFAWQGCRSKIRFEKSS